jgi:hypothetical protein
MRWLFEELFQFSDETWGDYAFGRDPLNQKVTGSQRAEIVKKSYECGRENAIKLINRFGALSIEEYAGRLGIQLKYKSEYGPGNTMMFAKFESPDLITLYGQNIALVKSLIEETGTSELFKSVNLEHIILAHEMFHFIERGQDHLHGGNNVCLWEVFRFQV